jgi:capsid protein
MLAGELPSPAFNDYWTRPEKYNAPMWQARSWDGIDPLKDMVAMEKARALLLESHSQQIANYNGEQFENVMAQIAMENELKESLGLMPTVEEAPEPQPNLVPEPDEEEEDGEGGDQPQPTADAEAEG